jgi:hypothetical protein
MILQVTSVARTATEVTESTSYVSVISCEITPASATSDVLVQAQILVEIEYDMNNYEKGICYAQLYHGTTPIGMEKKGTSSDSGGSAMNDNAIINFAWVYVDSPNSISSETYSVKIKTTDPSSSMDPPDLTVLDGQIVLMELIPAPQ